MSGLDLFRRLHESDAKVPVILMTGFGTAATAIEAMRLGAFDYLVKPPDLDHLTELVARACKISELMRGAGHDRRRGAGRRRLGHAGRPLPRDAGGLQGDRPRRPAGRDRPHPGRERHGQGAGGAGHPPPQPPPGGPFLAINCAAIPENLLESELFGHEKGAFTGADRRRVGKFEQANGGTLFLDEIGDMTPLTQAKLLRVLQDQQFEPVGGNQTIKADVRIIAATNRDLPALMAQGRFRDDLYYRLNVSTIRLPPLRERGEDVPLLVQHFLRRFGREMGKGVQRSPRRRWTCCAATRGPATCASCKACSSRRCWRRRARCCCRSSCPTRCAGGAGGGGAGGRLRGGVALGGRAPGGRHDRPARRTDLARGAAAVRDVLRHTGGNMTQAVRVLGITRGTLRTKLAALGLAADRAVDDELPLAVSRSQRVRRMSCGATPRARNGKPKNPPPEGAERPPSRLDISREDACRDSDRS